METVQLLVSPWRADFEAFSRLINQHALLVSPFITKGPLQHLAGRLVMTRHPRVEILTNLAVDNLIQGTTDPKCIAEFCRAIPDTVVTHLPSLHAKVYVADDRVAIVTSANLTGGGVSSNYEYGVWIDNPSIVERISHDLKSYAALGAIVSLLELDQLAAVSEELQHYQGRILTSARRTLRSEFNKRISAAHETLREIRAKPGESTNAIFSRTILFLLKGGPLTTQQLHPLIQQIHPDLCDNTIDRVIRGVHFGKRWKHMVRNAQQTLKDLGLTSLLDGKWHLSE